MSNAIRIYICQKCASEFSDETAWHKKTIVTDPTGQEHIYEQNIPVCPLCHIANYTLQFRAKPKPIQT
ncbi:MAG: hypothetical protein LBH74_05285 [Nitrososphaerota archaeon]|uniref:hypothetical protein n=1 Tax=Candidatus Bathycorpusculum sp. TaxID=2994959 RepID=UPI00281E90CD|nr:hypothetical protein [Candidatus Termitimicrobium sp.]MCL2432568.1 hypothetical protein [Candidatus Termitimicrobium sp.]MDR0493031.1 hypothetical protein [Nitrososphaerota archaeon]